ncbi:selenium-dependent molybdenum cofactor biosynthesis protein YqeB [Chloroflexota bacterium]
MKGGGDLASGVAIRLFRSGFPVVITELPQPMVIRRPVAFAEAVYTGETSIEGVVARRVDRVEHIWPTLREGLIPVIVDPKAHIVEELHPTVLIDAIVAKRNMGTSLSDAPIVIALGPGFEAGVDAHAIVETNRGHDLGRVLWTGWAEPNTGIPSSVDGYAEERVLRAPVEGVVSVAKRIGEFVQKGEVVAWVNGTPVAATIQGVLRGLIKEGIKVAKGIKMGDIDPRGQPNYCFTVSDKALAVGGGVLEAVLYHLIRLQQKQDPPD